MSRRAVRRVNGATRSELQWYPGAAGRLDGDEGPQSWRDSALCAETDPEAFFPEKGGSTREAKRVCRSCPVIAECREYALANNERYGIWGGLSERERRRLVRPDGTGLVSGADGRYARSRQGLAA